MPKRIPIAVAREVGRANGLSQVILCAWDGKLTHVVTWGKTTEDCSQAAIGGNRIKNALGWPKDLHAEPSRVRALREAAVQAEQELAAWKAASVLRDRIAELALRWSRLPACTCRPGCRCGPCDVLLLLAAACSEVDAEAACQ